MIRFWLSRLLVPSAALLALACAAAHEEGADAPATKTLMLFNPFDGLEPYLHGEHDNFKSLSRMSPEGCGWYSYEVVPGQPFRFYAGGNWEGQQWGTTGYCVATEDPSQCHFKNFNLDALFATSKVVYLWPDSGSKLPLYDVERPFECAPPVGTPPPNPYAQGQLSQYARAGDALQVLETWMTFFEAAPPLARVKFDDPALTVSEGIGYGMLAFAFLADARTDAQTDFDALYAYYQQFSDANGLMHWKVSGFSEVVQANAASDADLDVAVALLVADQRWGRPVGDTRYEVAARAMMERIRIFEFDAAGYLNPGDAWESPKNPSYFNFVAFELFARTDTANAAFWTEVIDRHYALLEAAQQRSGAGLVANWTDVTGVPADPRTGYSNFDAFGFDAIRVPWRVAWAYLWFGDLPQHARSQAIASRFCRFAQQASGADPTQLKAEYALDGTPISALAAGPGAVGAYAASCSADPLDAATLDAMYAGMKGQTASWDVTYYQTSLQLLETLLLTGRMPNPWAG